MLTAITRFINLLLDGKCPAEARPVIFGGKLIALTKKDGGLRPITVGYTLLRLAAKCANTFCLGRMEDKFAPIQLGVGTAGGCEAAVHATRRFMSDMVDGEAMVKLDFTNAFNSIRRDAVLATVASTLPLPLLSFSLR